MNEKKNRVQECRENELLPRSQLAHLAGLNEKTIKNAELGLTKTTTITKKKITKGFNSLVDKQQEYTVEYLFGE